MKPDEEAYIESRQPGWREENQTETYGPRSLDERKEPLVGYGTVDHPRHYNAHPSGVECIIVAEGFSFNLGNVIKYIWRAEEKGTPIEDLRKARWYLDREITRRESPNAQGSTTEAGRE